MLVARRICQNSIARASLFKEVLALFVPLSRTSALALLLLVPGSVFPDFGDHWIPRQGDVPLLSGPENSYSILARLSPTDVVRQESNKVIRGFLKVVLLREPPVKGYVEQDSLLFVGKLGQSSGALTKGAPLPPRPKTLAFTPIAHGTSWAATLLWTTVGVAVFVVVAFVIAWLLPGGKELPVVRELAGFDMSRFKSGLRQFASERGFLRTPSDSDKVPRDFDPRELLVGFEASQGSLQDRGRRMLEMGDIENALWIKAMTLSEGRTAVAREVYLDLWTAKYGDKATEKTKRKPVSPGLSSAHRSSKPAPSVAQGGRPSPARPEESETRSPIQATLNGRRTYLLPLTIIGGGIFVPMVASAIFLSQTTFFVVQPIRAVPEGITMVAWRSDFGRLVDSPDAMCKRRLGQVTLLCRGATLAAFVDDHEIIARLPYNESLYNVSFSK